MPRVGKNPHRNSHRNPYMIRLEMACLVKFKVGESTVGRVHREAGKRWVPFDVVDDGVLVLRDDVKG